MVKEPLMFHKKSDKENRNQIKDESKSYMKDKLTIELSIEV